MDISKARRLIELTKGDRKILVTLWESGQISNCVTDQEMQSCESCQGDGQLCEEWVNYLKEQGYEASEVALGELPAEESLPKFIEEREPRIEPKERGLD